MGILRTDRVTGLGGANAIKGSVFFGSFGGATYGNQIIVDPDSELDIAAGNFTVECWFYTDQDSGYQSLVGQQYYKNSGSGTNAFMLYLNNDGIYVWNRLDGSFSNVFGVTGLWKVSTWNHVAFVREGTGSNENKIYVNGSLAGSAFTNSANYTSGQLYHIGGNHYSNDDLGQYPINGYISNVRISNVARYTANFTLPTSEFVVDSNTILLACQSPSNILKEETGKTLYFTNVLESQPPLASSFTPNSPVGFSTTTDVGGQYGSTFDGFSNFASSSYMVPPAGNTRERNRGRAVMAGGMSYPTANAPMIEMLEIQSGGHTQDFGDLITATSTSGPVSSSTRGVFVAGLGSPSRVNVIEFVTIANTGNATDFGDYVGLLGYVGGVSNETRGVTCGGSGPSSPTGTDQMAYITIATAGDATNFGDLSGNAQGAMGVQSSTRGVFNLGYVGGFVNTIEYITIASTGDTTSFGTLSRTNSAFGGSCCSSTRGLFAGGYNNTPAPATEVNNIDYITIASTGDSVDFGDLVTPGFYCFGTSNKTRGIFQGRLTTAPYTGDPMIDSVTIATLGNAVEWGEMYRMDSGPHDGQPLVRRGATSVSDSHGGV